MNTYRVTYSATIRWRSRQSHSIDVAAENEQQAGRLADELFDDDFDPDNWNADVVDIDADIDSIECIAEDTSEPVVRCDKTIDLFRTPTETITISARA